ncbi:hypothetical protein [Sphingomonas glacialis]|uniref:hypothetical protein n=1 Tax=Sphingomonas glacialis TaxID=658225 RepID=UPI00167A2A58|nr:hypothetical protein [Sphingomonas glacialis]
MADLTTRRLGESICRARVKNVGRKKERERAKRTTFVVLTPICPTLCVVAVTRHSDADGIDVAKSPTQHHPTPRVFGNNLELLSDDAGTIFA